MIYYIVASYDKIRGYECIISFYCKMWFSLVKLTRLFDFRVYVLLMIWPRFTYTDDAYLGCFYDNYNVEEMKTDLNLRVLPLALLQSINMTIGTCISHCVDYRDDIRYAGVENGNQCFCGTADADYNQNGRGRRPENECSQNCYGNENQTCGNGFKIAVYNLSRIQCQIPEMRNFLNSGDLVPVQSFAIFECLLDDTLIGTLSVQCVFDDSITDARWQTRLPSCKPTSSETEPSSATAIMRLPTTTLESSTLSSNGSETIVIIAGAAGGALLVIGCVMAVVIGRCWKTRQRRRHRESTIPVLFNGTQNNNITDTPSYDTVHREAPVYITVNKDSYNTPTKHNTHGDESHHHDNYNIPPLHNKEQEPDPSYSYADVSSNLNVLNAKITDQRDADGTEESGWAENDLYSLTGDNEEVHEGWSDNSIYATTSN